MCVIHTALGDYKKLIGISWIMDISGAPGHAQLCFFSTRTLLIPEWQRGYN